MTALDLVAWLNERRRRVHVFGHDAIAVRDDGHGFDLTPERLRGLGLKAMRDCATSIGGDFWVGSKVGVGTTVRFSVPYNVLEEVAGE